MPLLIVLEQIAIIIIRNVPLESVRNIVREIADAHGPEVLVDYAAAARAAADVAELEKFGPEPTTNRGRKAP